MNEMSWNVYYKSKLIWVSKMPSRLGKGKPRTPIVAVIAALTAVVLLSSCTTSNQQVGQMTVVEEAPSSAGSATPTPLPSQADAQQPTSTPTPTPLDWTDVRQTLKSPPLIPELWGRDSSVINNRSTAEDYAFDFQRMRDMLQSKALILPEASELFAPLISNLERRQAKADRISRRTGEDGLKRGAWELFAVDWHCSVLELANLMEETEGTPFNETMDLLPRQVELMTGRAGFGVLDDMAICSKFDKGFPRLISNGEIAGATPDWLSSGEVRWIQQNVAAKWVIALSPLVFVPYAYDNDSVRFWAAVLSGPRFGKCRGYLALAENGLLHAPDKDDGACI